MFYQQKEKIESGLICSNCYNIPLWVPATLHSLVKKIKYDVPGLALFLLSLTSEVNDPHSLYIYLEL